MCTVSFYKSNKKIVITSNRDENSKRLDAIPNQIEQNGSLKHLFPLDPQSSGSWFIVNNHGNAFVLLNGADFKHEYCPPYSRSRGLILKEIATSSDFMDSWKFIDLFNIEPFTIIAFVQSKLYHLSWNGEIKTFNELDSSIPHVWSSATLYSPEVSNLRKSWFNEFIPFISSDFPEINLFKFHRNTKPMDHINGLIINRNGNIITKNITQFVSDGLNLKLIHHDLINNTQSEIMEKIL